MFEKRTDLALERLEQESYVSPGAGVHRQPVQMIDLDTDGIQEALAFTQDYNGLCRIHVLKSYDSEYQLVNSFSGDSPDIYEVQYPNLTPDGIKGIAVAWGRPEDVSRGVTVIALHRSGPAEVMTFFGQSYLFQDTDGDGADEIWYADRGGTAWIRSRLQRYEYEPGRGFLPTGRLMLAAEAAWTVRLQAGICHDGTPTMFADSLTEDNASMVTDLVVDSAEGLVSLTQGGADTAVETMRRSRAYCTDINGDGVLEVPVDMESYPNWLSRSEQFLTWCDFCDPDLGPQPILDTFFMPDEGLALVLSGNWDSGARVTRWLDDSGRVVYSFYDMGMLLNQEELGYEEELILRLCIGETYRVDEMDYENIVILEEIAVGYQIPGNTNQHIRLSEQQVREGLHLLQDRW